jgi:(4S)-4-hydroxy-5-phosphonooxypentane-2,3-dione isomerase
MYVLFVKVQVKPEFRDQYVATTVSLDAKGSVGDEPGCYRFDVLQDEKDPNIVYFYEVYRDRAAFDAHTQAPHFLKWRDAVAGWTAGPTEVLRAFTVFPEDSGWQKQGI